MTTVVLVRHGRTTANAGGVLAGWTAGVGLDEGGRDQAAALGRRLAGVPLAAVVSSPLERCVQTAELVFSGRLTDPEPQSRRPRRGGPELRVGALRTDERLGECRYGDWTGRELKALAKDPLWQVVQVHPSAARFPGTEGESLRDMQIRAVDAVRDWNARLGEDATWVAVSHGDVIKAVLADALGVHLDQFQRLVVDPCSVSIVTYTRLRPFVVRVNDIGGDLSGLVPRRRPRRRRGADSDAVVGGGAGS